jgi:hypothetical protein
MRRVFICITILLSLRPLFFLADKDTLWIVRFSENHFDSMFHAYTL